MYTEIKKRNKSCYYYRCRTIRVNNRFKKERVYLGRNLQPEELKQFKKDADKRLDQKKIEQIKEHIKKDKSWFFYSAVIVPHLNSPVIEAYQKLRKKYPLYTLEWYFTFYAEEGEASGWILSGSDQATKSLRLFDNTAVLDRLFAQWKKEAEKYNVAIKSLEEGGIVHFKEDYKRFIKAYIHEFTPALILESFYMGLDEVISRIIAKYPSHKNEVNFLIEPSRVSFSQEEQESLLSIALMIKNACPRRDVMKSLREHKQRFFWIQNNYKYADPISIDTFYNRALETSETVKDIENRIRLIRNYEHLRIERKKKILKNVPFTPKERQILRWCSILSWWQDQRKKANLKGDYWLNQFLRRIGKEYDYSLIQMQHTDIPEVLELFEGKRINKTLLNDRMQAVMHYVDPDGHRGFLSREEAIPLMELMIKKRNDCKVTDFRGITGSVGIAQGRVKIIRNPKNSDIEKGDILVTGMTRPEFVPLMKKAAAIVTDEGGVTCHAAIVSRELGIPCIIGTKIATKVLKDGDEVIVNANHASVRIVNKI